MATSDGPTVDDRQPAAKPLGTSSPLPRTPMNSARDPRPSERIESLQKTIESILNGTEWPSESKDAAKGLLSTVKSSPDIPNSTTSISPELRDLIEQYIRTLDDVHSRLKDASSKSGMRRWKILERIKSFGSNRPSKCTLLFQTCQDDVTKIVASFNECLENERKNEQNIAVSGVLPGSYAGQAPGAPSNVQTTPAERGITSADSTAGASLTQHPPSSVSENGKSQIQIRAEALTIARKTFKGVEIASGSIPVVGNFVAAAAKVGLAFVESIQTMDSNDDLAKDLGAQTDKLSMLLAAIAKKRTEDQGEGIDNHVTSLQTELREMHGKVKEWESLGRFNKAFHSRDQAEALKGYQGTIQTALEEMQLLVGIDTRSIVIELKNSEVQKEKRRLLDRLGDGKYGARGNAVDDVTCFPGTRVRILERIDTWIRDSSTANRVLWIRGMAGRGKSTIASTAFRDWKCRASCAIFHFRRGQDTLNTRVVCALARQLGNSLVPEVRNAVLESVQENQDIADERLEEQFKALFVTSLTRLDNQNHPILIVVDALDECDNPGYAGDFVRLIDRHSASLPANVKFLLTSRPETHLVRALEPKQWRSEDLDTAADVSGDLERFIQQAFKQIRDSDPNVPKDWPSSENVSGLVEMSQGLFQWARTAITYIQSGSPMSRLRGLLKRPSKWSGLDDLYHQILSKAFDSFKLDPERGGLLHRVLGTLVVAPYPISTEVIAGLYGDNDIFDEMDHAEVILFLRQDILADLNSLLFIPTSSNEPIRLMHTSIHDLLVSEDRCERKPYHINIIQYHQQLASLCFRTMFGRLTENICNLADLSKSSSEIQDIAEREVSKVVLYCCRSWSTHITEGIKWPNPGTSPGTVEAGFKLFGREKVMGWLEVMSLVGATTDAMRMARRVYQWCSECPVKGSEFSSLAPLWNDVQRFITMFLEPISFGPLHIYASALPHCPVKTEIWDLYGKHAKVRTLQGHQTSGWPSNLWTRSTGARVNAVAFSPDGKLLACGSSDNTIQLWDPQTGTAIGEPLTGHSGSVRSVCFAPDGRRLASGSDDQAIRFWDPQTGTTVGEPLTGHSGSILSVCFSPDGKLLASGSSDKTIRLWDPQTGTVVGEPLEGHDSSVRSVCFSPDGQLMASGSDDNTIQLWDPQTGAGVGEPFKGHSHFVRSVCFSPDGKLLASGSWDGTVQLWDPQTGNVVGEPLIPCGSSVQSVCFSPVGKLLAFGSYGTIQLWDLQTRTPVGEPLNDPSNWVRSVCFSPDGRLLASGSDDKTIQLWDPQTGTTVAEPLTGHRRSVQSICLSPDGRYLASGSSDGAVWLWDCQTGAVVGGPLTGHSEDVISLCFSPDGKLLASGSKDETIRIWDPQTGTAVCEPLTGHSDSVMSVCFSPDGRLLASGSDDMTSQIWDPRTGTEFGEPLAGHDSSVRSVCFSPDGQLMASGSDDNTIQLWDPQTGTGVGEPFEGHSDYVTSVCFSPDGSHLASGSRDKTVRFWDLQTQRALGNPLTGHSDWVTSVRFSSNGNHLMANYNDGGFAAWDPNTHQRLDAPSDLLGCSSIGFQDHWITVFSSRLFWLPSPYWGGGYVCQVILSGKTLVVLGNENLAFFDVSQILEL